ncbi:flagellar hook-associated protein 3 FlgL [Brevinema andersonii]|uniref:Flagellar hook-associated protein 3 FlgL n=1 Tax=Brevinema andersonii TaxID=34097 RepID=A0A1I1D890_BREAD|nr:flagellar hook-associated protein 3 [Brevinema andersonii]SFB71219.1 flagellar hook-associated protein 3 FlgL [Brevinema andersonii]
MIGRVTQGFMKDDFLQNLKNNNENLQRTQRKLNSGMKILLPSDDPANTINYMKWTGKTQDLNKYNEIIGAYKNKLNFVDGHLDSVTQSLQRIRELTVQAANGIYTKEDRIVIAGEVDQLIRQIVSTGNAEYKGMPVFGGTSTNLQPYRITENFEENMNMPFVSRIDYFGNAQERVMDIGRNDRITSVMPGTNIFETTKTIIQGTRDISGYVATQDAKIMIEGTEINILTGDNLETIAQKINDSDLTVRASIQTQADGSARFRLEAISAREPWLQDTAGGTVFQDLGILNPSSEAPRNYATAATIQRNTIFNTLIRMRDQLMNDDVYRIGGESLGLLDQSISNILRYRTYTGAVAERLEKTFARNETEALYLKDSAANATGTDYAKTITELKMAEFAHQTALNVGAKIIPTTLLDFLR